MLLIDQLRSTDQRLRAVAWGILAGTFTLVLGLWYLQILSAGKFRASEKNQSFRTVRIPALRGKIIDRHGRALADNRPSFNINLYLEELRPSFTAQYYKLKAEFIGKHGKQAFNRAVMYAIEQQARYSTASNLTWTVSAFLERNQILQESKFHRHYGALRSLPLPVLNDLSTRQIALYSENNIAWPGVAMEIQPLRTYPYGPLASHVLGHVRRNDKPREEEEFQCKYSLPDVDGGAGIEAAFDKILRGSAGVKSILVNHDGYRETEEIWPEPEPGMNVMLSLDYEIQAAAENALQNLGADTKGAAVVMDVQTGDILALASAPSFDPNLFATGLSHEQWAALNDPELTPMFNRATQGYYPPASVMKIIVGLACLESGINPSEKIYTPGYFRDEKRLGRRAPIDDTAPAGDYDFERALKLSSNTYFIHHGLNVGADKIVEVGRRFRLGKKTGLLSGQEGSGYFPPEGKLGKRGGGPWLAGDTANLCIGQGEVAVTPLQVAVLLSAVANGGKILRPRLVLRTRAPEGYLNADIQTFAPEVLDRVSISPRHLEIIHRAMLADVEDADGTGRRARVPGARICGKTGTAQLGQNRKKYATWFASFAPFERPRYSVVVTVETMNSGSGGVTCAPVAQKIYQALMLRGDPASPAQGGLAQHHYVPNALN